MTERGHFEKGAWIYDWPRAERVDNANIIPRVFPQIDPNQLSNRALLETISDRIRAQGERTMHMRSIRMKRDPVGERFAERVTVTIRDEVLLEWR